MTFKAIVKYFDKLEDRIRGKLSRIPILYAFIGGFGVVLFWRGVWHTSDILMAKGGFLGFIFYEPITIIWIVVVMLLTGLFVSFFIGDRILLSGIKHEKKVEEKTEEEVLHEEMEISQLSLKIDKLSKDIEEIKNLSRSKFNEDKEKNK